MNLNPFQRAAPWRATFIATLCSLAAGGVSAQGTPPRPSGGTLLQQLQPQVGVPPAGAAPALPDAPAPRALAAPSSGGPVVMVQGFRLVGVGPAQAAALLPLLQKSTGPGKTLLDLEDAAKDVEVALQRQGFFLAQVYVPEQTLADGIVTLQVLIGRIGAVKIEAEPGVQVAPEFMDRIVAMLRGNPVAERELVERALFTLSDLRGISIRSALTPGDKVGQADLSIQVSPGPATSGSIEAENGGSIFTGRYRLSPGVERYNLLGRGDVASLKAQVSTSGGTAFMRAAWLVPVNDDGTKFGVAASFLKYRLGDDLESLQAHGTASALSLQWLHPQWRSRNANLFLQASADLRAFDDRVDTSDLRVKKTVTGYVTLGVVGDFRDTLFGGGISNYSANLIAGRLKIKNPAELDLDQGAEGYGSAGNYAKLVLGATRLQVLPNKDYLYLSTQAQLTGKNLDSSEKFSIGGPNGVRAYPAPESPSDSGAIAGWEYRKPLVIEAYPGDWVVAVFGDYGIARLHQDPLATDKHNTRKLYGHGIGLTYGNATGLTVRAHVAVRGPAKAQSDDSRARLFVQLSQQY